MEDLVIVKASDISAAFNILFQEVHSLRQEIESLRQHEDTLKTYSVLETSKLIGFHYKTILKMVRRGILAPVHTENEKGRYRITFASIKAYLEKKSQKINSKK